MAIYGINFLIIFLIFYQLNLSTGSASHLERSLQSKNDKSTTLKGSADKNAELENDEDSEDDTVADYKSKVDGKRTGPKVWDRWGKWGGCSVTCGIGRMTRWRHCVSGGCAAGEKEAQIRTCTLSAC